MSYSYYCLERRSQNFIAARGETSPWELRLRVFQNFISESRISTESSIENDSKIWKKCIFCEKILIFSRMWFFHQNETIFWVFQEYKDKLLSFESLEFEYPKIRVGNMRIGISKSVKSPKMKTQESCNESTSRLASSLIAANEITWNL